MSMIKEFAVEPGAIVDWHTFRYVMEKFGIPEGRVLSRLPKGWVKILLESVTDQVDRLRIEEYLRVNQSARVGPMGRPYDRTISWSANALDAHAVREYAGVIVAKEKDSRGAPIPFKTPTALDAQFFHADRDMLVPSTASGLLLPAELLIATASRIILIDPYLSVVQSAYNRTLTALIEILAKYNCEYLRLVSSVKATGMTYLDSPAFASWAAHTVGKRRINIELFILGSSRRKRQPHPRYLLTEAGGLRYERGFAADGQDLECDVSLLGATMHERLLSSYTDGRHGFEVAHAYTWP